MRITTIFLLSACLTASANGITQHLTLEEKNVKLEKIFKEIKKQSGYVFFYKTGVLQGTKPVSINVNNVSVEEVLHKVLDDQQLGYSIQQKTVTVFKKVFSGLPATIVNTIPLADTFSIKGIITNIEDNSPIEGVSVINRNTGKGAQTNKNGQFSINASPGNQLVISHVSFGEMSYVVKNRDEVLLKMTPKSVTMSTDVIVVGYGTQRRPKVSGAIDFISGKDINERPIPNINAGLQGLIPNLNITTGSGRVTDVAALNVRGFTSLSGGNPYILVDNVPYSQEELSLLNPADIESISVLKDAASSAIYGAKAAFGVILVTTKAGKSDKLVATINSYLGLKTMGKLPQIITDPYLSYTTKREAALPINTSLANDPVYRDYAKKRSDDPSLPGVFFTPGNLNYQYMGSTDWFAEAFDKTSQIANTNFSISKKTDNIAYYLSGEYAKNNGAIKNANEVFKRYNVRSKIDIKVLDWLHIGNNTGFVNSTYNTPTYANNDYEYFWQINRQSSTDMIYNPDGTYTEAGAGTIGRVQKGGRTINTVNNFVTTLNATASIIKDQLDVKSDITIKKDAFYQKIYDFRVPYSVGPNLPAKYVGPGNSYIYNANTQLRSTIYNLFADYHTTTGLHYFQALAGYNQQSDFYQTNNATKTGLISSTLPTPGLATGGANPAPDEDIWEVATRSFFGRLNYVFDNKYILELNGRYDGTSRFPKGDRWGFFPSASAAWVVTNESFFKPVAEKIRLDFFKIRASYGALGNQETSNAYPYIPVMQSGTIGQILGGSRPLAVYDPRPVSSTLTWEKVSTLNLGTDISLLKNRLDIIFDKYTRKTVGMLTKGKTLPAVFGATPPDINAADLKTKGWELRVGWKDNVTVGNSPLRYNISLNLSDNRTFITKYDNPTGNLGDYYVGKELGEIWGLETEGFFQSTDEITKHANQLFFVSDEAGRTFGVGDLKWKDQNGDGFVNNGKNRTNDHGDLIRIGNATPRYRYGADIGLSWKGFDIRSFFQGVGKQDFYPRNNNVYFWSVFAQPWTTVTVQALDRWSPDNPNAYFPRLKSYIAEDLTELGYPQTRYLQNFAYLRLKNLTIGYSVSKKITDKIKMSKIRFYLSGENIFSKSGVKFNLDPEALNGNVYPYQKTFTFGINATF